MILGLCIALAGVVYAMRYTQSFQFQRGLDLFFNPNSPQMWNWCPPNAEKIDILGPQHFAHELSMNEICQVIIEPVPEDRAQRKLEHLLKVSSGQASKILESDEAFEVFRVDGLIFQSEKLSKALQQP